MINNIVNAISIKLNLVFGDAYTKYIESIEQGLQEPCFFIKLLTSDQTQIIGKRYFRQQPFDIHYFPSTEDANAEMLNIADSLNDALEYITLENGDVLHGTKLNGEIIDGVLHFFANYNLYVIKTEVVADYMEDVTVESEVTKG